MLPRIFTASAIRPAAGSPARSMNWPGSRSVGIWIEEGRIPVKEEVRGACELLGLDPFILANEGKLIAIVAPGSGGKNSGADEGPSARTGEPSKSEKCGRNPQPKSF